MLNLQNTTPLSEDEIRSLAPSIFTEVGSPTTTSEKYCHISTWKIIQDMAVLGWYVSDVKEVKARKESNKGYQKHLIIFRNNEIQITGEDGDVVFPQILLTNSHDGKNAFIFTAGLFRFVCENGLITSTQNFENLKIRHYGYSIEELENVVNKIVEELPKVVDSMNEFKATILTDEQILDFAQKMVATRFTEEELPRITIDYDDLLTPTRFEDNGKDLWSVFNLLQEKLIHGMFNYQAGKKTRKARKIKNFKQDMVLNEKLYSLALTFINK